MDIIVTTPKSRMAEAAQEAADCIKAGGGEYFRRFTRSAPRVGVGDRVYYVEDGLIRGFAIVEDIMNTFRPVQCDTTGRWYEPGFYVFMRADSWKWIEPVPMVGFRNYRYVKPRSVGLVTVEQIRQSEVVGGWLDPKPEPAAAGL